MLRELFETGFNFTFLSSNTTYYYSRLFFPSHCSRVEIEPVAFTAYMLVNIKYFIVVPELGFELITVDFTDASSICSYSTAQAGAHAPEIIHRIVRAIDIIIFF